MFSLNPYTRQRQQKAAALFVTSGVATALLLQSGAPRWQCAPLLENVPSLMGQMDFQRSEIRVQDCKSHAFVRTIPVPVDPAVERVAGTSCSKGMIEVQVERTVADYGTHWLTFDLASGKLLTSVKR
ncbi:hypothetical protein [Armatimonas sp.]|uniref:hypothetical protein n=1 Tax=Armatimonas sp. TaxID=1872638 RepID=UPI0037514645